MIFAVSYLTVVLNCHYLSKKLTIEIDVLDICRYKETDIKKI